MASRPLAAAPRQTITSRLAAAAWAVVLVLPGCIPDEPSASPPSSTPVVSATPLISAIEARVSVGLGVAPFAQNQQDEPAVAIDPVHPEIVAAAANDRIDQGRCAGVGLRDCSTRERDVGTAGIYFSFDAGKSWIQPTYHGLGARNCEAMDCVVTEGPIGTIPNQAGAGLRSGYDPGLAFGPRFGTDGRPSWSNGSRLYHINISDALPGPAPVFRGRAALVLNRIDGDPMLTREIVADQGRWLRPVIIGERRGDPFAERPMLWVDNAEHSQFFGRAYTCHHDEVENAPWPTVVNRSADGGDTWTEVVVTERRLDSCAIRSDSLGTVYVFGIADFGSGPQTAIARSYDGGVSFEALHPIQPDARFLGCGGVDPVQEFLSFDGRAGSRTPFSYLSADIANGAPSGADATDRIVVTTCEASRGRNRERAMVLTSIDGGDIWTEVANAAEPGDRPDMPAVAISPDGRFAWLVYLGFLDPFRDDLEGDRRALGVVRWAATADLEHWETVHRGAVGDTRGTARFVFAEGMSFVGDFQQIAATRDSVVAVWTDVRAAVRCPAMEAYRAGLLSGEEAPLPVPGIDCPDGFGDSDIHALAATLTSDGPDE